jgi:hypothetical protein
MRRTTLVVAMMLTALLMLSGTALAKEILGTPRDDRLVGTARGDVISARGGDDTPRLEDQVHRNLLIPLFRIMMPFRGTSVTHATAAVKKPWLIRDPTTPSPTLPRLAK